MPDYPTSKTPLEHHRDMLAIARQQLAWASTQSISEPDNPKWPTVIIRLTNWLERLESEEHQLATPSTSSFPEAAGSTA